MKKGIEEKRKRWRGKEKIRERKSSTHLNVRDGEEEPSHELPKTNILYSIIQTDCIMTDLRLL